MTDDGARVKFLGRFRVGVKLVGAFLLVVLLLSLVSATVLVSMRRLNTATDDLLHNRSLLVINLADVRADALRIRERVLLHVFTRDADAKRQYATQIEGLESSLLKSLDAYAAAALTPQERDALETFKESWTGYREARSRVLDLSESGRFEEAVESVTSGAGRQRFEAALAAADNLMRTTHSATIYIHEAVEAAAAGSSRTASYLILVVAWIAVVLGVISTRNVSRPAVAVAEAARRVAAGDLTVPELPVASADEIGQMARAFNEMVRELRAKTETNARLMDELREHARTDSLTGARNYRYLMEILAGTASLTQPAGKKTAVIFLDIDRLNEINAAFGHLAGDALLERVGRRLLAAAPADSTVIRFGADEFLVLASAAGEEEAVALAERVREGIGGVVEIPTDIGEECPVQLSISIGVAVDGIDRPGDLRALIRKADLAMSLARGKGGNCVVSAPEHLPL